ncbi:hypothetical protein SESBI_37991 [Sesbania bispinosa]|nr:hypothetical protein SESBI_37991 [Sesbania bispinosa]
MDRWSNRSGSRRQHEALLLRSSLCSDLSWSLTGGLPEGMKQSFSVVTAAGSSSSSAIPVFTHGRSPEGISTDEENESEDEFKESIPTESSPPPPFPPSSSSSSLILSSEMSSSSYFLLLYITYCSDSIDVSPSYSSIVLSFRFLY